MPPPASLDFLLHVPARLQRYASSSRALGQAPVLHTAPVGVRYSGVRTHHTVGWFFGGRTVGCSFSGRTGCFVDRRTGGFVNGRAVGCFFSGRTVGLFFSGRRWRRLRVSTAGVGSACDGKMCIEANEGFARLKASNHSAAAGAPVLLTLRHVAGPSRNVCREGCNKCKVTTTRTPRAGQRTWKSAPIPVVGLQS